MKFRLLTLVAAIGLVATSPAQNMEQGIPPDVLEAIREFNERPPGTPNEVVVVLDPPSEADDAGPPADDAEEVDDVVASILADKPDGDAPEAPGPEAPSREAGELPEGPAVRVQALRDTGDTRIKADDVRISSPFAAKPIGRPPVGWKLVSSTDAPEFTEKVEVAPGTWLTLSIRPHVLVPDADGRAVFQIPEPGFDPAMGYRQETTISSAIASSIDQLEADARVLGQVMDELEQILISLPRPDNLDAETEEQPE